MEKVRIRDLAKELGMDSSKEVLTFLERIGQKGKSASSNIEGDVIDRVRNHFRKTAPASPPKQTLVVTRADGVLERRSSKVVLRRGAPVAKKPPAPPAPEESATPPATPAAPAAPAASIAVATSGTGVPAAEAVPPPEAPPAEAEGEKPLEAVVRVVEKTPAEKAAEERKEKEKKWKKAKPHEKKVQKGILKRTIIQEIVEEPEPPKEPQAPAPEAEPVVVRQFQPVRAQKRRGKLVKEKKAPSTLPPKASKRVFKIEEVITVGDLAHRMGIKAAEAIKKLIEMGMPTTLNQLLDADTARILAQEYGYEVENVAPEVENLIDQEEDREEDLVPRPPVVTIMGHVDHGKTTLLDAIRQSHVTDQEAGGITQHIGAYEVEHGTRKLVLLDTPGHEAFTSMRARGASVTDIVVLVVAADDGVMPQTVEAIDHAKAAGVPIVVAVNKVDKEDANPARVRQQLTEYDLVAEEYGGKTQFVDVSAKTQQNLDTLVETILLVADVELNLKANPDRRAQGSVIEAHLDKGRGPVATILVRRGTLHVGDAVAAGTA